MFFGREITKYTVLYGAYIRYWPTLLMCSPALLCPSNPLTSEFFKDLGRPWFYITPNLAIWDVAFSYWSYFAAPACWEASGQYVCRYIVSAEKPQSTKSTKKGEDSISPLGHLAHGSPGERIQAETWAYKPSKRSTPSLILLHWGVAGYFISCRMMISCAVMQQFIFNTGLLLWHAFVYLLQIFIFLKLEVCEGHQGLQGGTEPIYTGACRHPLNLDFISISKLENQCFHMHRCGIYQLKRHWHTCGSCT